MSALACTPARSDAATCTRLLTRPHAQLSKFSGMLPMPGGAIGGMPKIPIPPTPKAGNPRAAPSGISPASKGAAAMAKKAVKSAAGEPGLVVQPPAAQDAKRLKTDATAAAGAPVPV